MTSPDLITTRTAAVILRTSHRTAVRLVERGILIPAVTAPTSRFGSFLFDRADVEALAAKRSEATK